MDLKNEKLRQIVCRITLALIRRNPPSKKDAFEHLDSAWSYSFHRLFSYWVPLFLELWKQLQKAFHDRSGCWDHFPNDKRFLRTFLDRWENCIDLNGVITKNKICIWAGLQLLGTFIFAVVIAHGSSPFDGFWCSSVLLDICIRCERLRTTVFFLLQGYSMVVENGDQIKENVDPSAVVNERNEVSSGLITVYSISKLFVFNYSRAKHGGVYMAYWFYLCIFPSILFLFFSFSLRLIYL